MIGGTFNVRCSGAVGHAVGHSKRREVRRVGESGLEHEERSFPETIGCQESRRRRRTLFAAALLPGSLTGSPDGSRVLSASLDQWATITTVDGPAHEPVRLRGSNGIHDAEFSPDGMSVVLGSSDGDVRVIPVTGGAGRVG